jgi:CheY-like chemotaxis protein
LGAEKGSIEGTGVGLAIAKRLTDAMGGRIDFDSHEDQGSVFWIEFPLIDAPPEVMQLATQPSLSLQLPPCRLLHIDGRPSGISRLKSLLEAFPQIERATAADAVEGIFAARTQRPDIVLFDGEVPGIAPADVARILKSDPLTAEIQFVAIGAKNCEAIDALLPKSFDLAQLAEVIGHCAAAVKRPGAREFSVNRP